jgi:hypothetical protein
MCVHIYLCNIIALRSYTHVQYYICVFLIYDLYMIQRAQTSLASYPTAYKMDNNCTLCLE